MRLLVAAALLVSAQAFACPDLSGSFTCKYEDGTSEVVTIAQENKDGVMVYSYNGTAIPADNKAYAMPDDQTLREGTLRAWCDQSNATALNAEILGKVFQQGQYYGDLTLDMVFSLEGNTLKQVTTGSIKGAQGEQPLNGEVSCTRN